MNIQHNRSTRQTEQFAHNLRSRAAVMRRACSFDYDILFRRDTPHCRRLFMLMPRRQRYLRAPAAFNVDFDAVAMQR